MQRGKAAVLCTSHCMWALQPTLTCPWHPGWAEQASHGDLVLSTEVRVCPPLAAGYPPKLTSEQAELPQLA